MPFLPLMPKYIGHNTQFAQRGRACSSFCMLKNSPSWALVPSTNCSTTHHVSRLHLSWFLLTLGRSHPEKKNYFRSDFMVIEPLFKLNTNALHLCEIHILLMKFSTCFINFSECGCIHIWVNLLLSVHIFRCNCIFLKG